MKKKNAKPDDDNANLEMIKIRLDAIVTLLIKSKFSDQNGRIRLTR